MEARRYRRCKQTVAIAELDSSPAPRAYHLSRALILLHDQYEVAVFAACSRERILERACAILKRIVNRKYTKDFRQKTEINRKKLAAFVFQVE